MFRLTLLLFAGLLAALFTLGQDRGQLRPGLAKAEAEGRLDEVWAEARAKAVAAPVVVPAGEPVAEAVAVVAPAPSPAKPQVTLASSSPVVEVAAGREVVQVVEDPVFSLSALGNEAVPGEDGTPIDAAVAEAAADTTTTPDAQPDALPAGGTIWYVSADSVNVRSAPSTDADILDRLGAGEATLLVAAVDSEWAQIVIQGDGVEGYVALRYLSPEAP